MTRCFRAGFASLLVFAACARSEGGAGPSVRFLSPAETKPRGAAPHARHRLVATHADGSKDFALVLARGDEVTTALADFARDENVRAASFTAIGAVRDPEVAWFDLNRKQYKAMHFDEQAEVLSLLGDIGRDAQGGPVVHVHAVLGRDDGSTFGGHLIGATASPTLEVFVKAYPQPLTKQTEPGTGLQFFEP